MEKFRKTYRRVTLAIVRGFLLFYCAGSLTFTLAATVDLGFGLHWGWTWPAIPMGIAFAAFGLAMYWAVGKMNAFFERYFEPFRPDLLKADLESVRQPRR